MPLVISWSALTMIRQASCCPSVLSSSHCHTIDTSTNLLKVSTALEELSGTNNALCFAGILLLLHAGATEESLQLCFSVLLNIRLRSVLLTYSTWHRSLRAFYTDSLRIDPAVFRNCRTCRPRGIAKIALSLIARDEGTIATILIWRARLSFDLQICGISFRS